MYKLTVDIAKNRLDSMIAAPYTEDELIQLNKELKEQLRLLKPGFTVAVDNSRMSILPEEYHKYLLEAQSIIKEAGCGKVGTLLPNAVSNLQVSRFGRQTHLNELSQRFLDRKEWEAWLSETTG